MPDLKDGESVEMKGSAAKPYVLKNVGGVYSCSCPAWRNQSLAIEKRTCKHLRKLRGDKAEEGRTGGALPAKSKQTKSDKKTPPLLLAQTWDNWSDLTDWWMSEKLDGVRAYWDGKQFRSRLGNVYHAPDWFIEDLPGVPLDGELWMGRKAFQRTVSVVRRQDKSDHWKAIQYLVFDSPACEGGFETRMEFLNDCLTRIKTGHIVGHPHQVCNSLDHLREELARVEGLGGEGLMLRQPGSNYEVGRSQALLKVKTFHDDDAIVLEHVAGKGKHKGRLGAIVVQLPDHTTFSVGTGFSDAERSAPPPIGSVITFRYQELSDGGIPRFPSYVGVRKDRDLSEKAVAEAASAGEPEAESPSSPASGSSAAAGKSARYFEFVGAKSSKFWEIRTEQTEVHVRYGRIGTKGQSRVKSLADEDSANKQTEKLIREKTGKGYVEVAE